MACPQGHSRLDRVDIGEAFRVCFAPVLARSRTSDSQNSEGLPEARAIHWTNNRKMANQRWTLLLVPDGDDGVRQFRVNRSSARLIIGGSLLLLSVLVTFTTGFFIQEGHRQRAERLARENSELVAEVGQIRERLGSLQLALGDLSKQDEKFRLIAGLEPMDAEIRLAGIGGPGTETVQGSPLFGLDPEVAQLTFDASMDVEAMIRRANVLSSSWNEAMDSLRIKHALLRATPSIYPANGYVSSGFSKSRMHPILNRARPHEGLDIAALSGTPIRASANGVVSYAGRRGAYGNVVEIDHGFGYKTRYAHMLKYSVQRGQRVERGELIGEVGSTGLSTSPHLHYEVLVNGRPQNPALYILNSEVIPD